MLLVKNQVISASQNSIATGVEKRHSLELSEGALPKAKYKVASGVVKDSIIFARIHKTLMTFRVKATVLLASQSLCSLL